MRHIFHQSLLDFSKAIFRAAGSSREEAEIVATHLVESNLLGHDSHGVIRISKYVEWARDGRVAINRHAVLAVDHGALAVIDGQFGYGQVIGKEAMEIAAERAKAHGMAAVAIRNSGHLGRVGAWAEQLAARGLTSIHFVNTSGFGILVAPFGGSDRRLSANPIAAGVPNKDGRPVILDWRRRRSPKARSRSRETRAKSCRRTSLSMVGAARPRIPMPSMPSRQAPSFLSADTRARASLSSARSSLGPCPVALRATRARQQPVS
jgi:uncharacterized oxidoreductase